KDDADATQHLAVDAGLVEQFGDRGRDLSLNARGAVGGDDGAAPQAAQFTIAGADAQLEFRAADLDAEEHGLSPHTGRLVRTEEVLLPASRRNASSTPRARSRARRGG